MFSYSYTLKWVFRIYRVEIYWCVKPDTFNFPGLKLPTPLYISSILGSPFIVSIIICWATEPLKHNAVTKPPLYTLFFSTQNNTKL